MSCKCKNIIENWQGGTVPLSTTFLSPVQFNSLVTLLMSCQIISRSLETLMICYYMSPLKRLILNLALFFQVSNCL